MSCPASCRILSHNYIPGHSILPVDLIGNDRIRRRIAPDSDAFHEKPTGTHQFYAGIFAAGFRTGLRRIRSDRFRSYPTIGSSRNSSGPIHGKRRIMPVPQKITPDLIGIRLPDPQSNSIRKNSGRFLTNPITASYAQVNDYCDRKQPYTL